jgi:hypothetical protein
VAVLDADCGFVGVLIHARRHRETGQSITSDDDSPCKSTPSTQTSHLLRTTHGHGLGKPWARPSLTKQSGTLERVPDQPLPWSGRRDSNPRPSPWQREDDRPPSPPPAIMCAPVHVLSTKYAPVHPVRIAVYVRALTIHFRHAGKFLRYRVGSRPSLWKDR